MKMFTVDFSDFGSPFSGGFFDAFPVFLLHKGNNRLALGGLCIPILR